MDKKIKKILNILFILPFLAIFMSSCEKKPFDYRNGYIGDWQFTVAITKFNIDSVGQNETDTLTYQGEISYGDADDKIMIKYAADNSVTLTINKEGELSNFPTQYCGGTFDGKEKLHLYLRWGGLGGGLIHDINGIKN